MSVPNFDKSIKAYKEQVDNLINNLGKDVTVVFEKTITNVNTKFNDPVHKHTLKKPRYKATSANPAPTIEKNTQTVKALIKWDPSEFENFDIKIDKSETIVRLKTFLTDVPVLKRCDYIIPNKEVDPTLQSKFRLIKQAQPRGIRDDRYAYTYWTSSIDG